MIIPFDEKEHRVAESHIFKIEYFKKQKKVWARGRLRPNLYDLVTRSLSIHTLWRFIISKSNNVQQPLQCFPKSEYNITEETRNSLFQPHSISVLYLECVYHMRIQACLNANIIEIQLENEAQRAFFRSVESTRVFLTPFSTETMSH